MDIQAEKEKIKQRRKDKKKQLVKGGVFSPTMPLTPRNKSVKIYTGNTKINKIEIHPKNNIFYHKTYIEGDSIYYNYMKMQVAQNE